MIIMAHKIRLTFDIEDLCLLTCEMDIDYEEKLVITEGLQHSLHDASKIYDELMKSGQ